MPEPDLEHLLERAAKQGAMEALVRLGLADKDAPKDMSELRSMLGAWRAARSEIFRTIIHWSTVVGIAAIATLLTIKSGYFKIDSH